MTYKNVQKLVIDAYFPTLNIVRQIHLPLEKPRYENDAEHSFSLSLIGSALAKKIGLNPGKVALYATYHDLLEIYSGDTSLWDKKGYETKIQREKDAIVRIKKDFNDFSLILKNIHNYESFADEEACFTYALDKLLPLIINIQDQCNFYHLNKITYEMHMAKVTEVRPKVSKHSEVLKWYDEAVEYARKNKEQIFYHE
jgi:5'-deoxynucleotidase YfbR-like HD superfamily hydrolase